MPASSVVPEERSANAVTAHADGASRLSCCAGRWVNGPSLTGNAFVPLEVVHVMSFFASKLVAFRQAVRGPDLELWRGLIAMGKHRTRVLLSLADNSSLQTGKLLAMSLS